MAIIERRYIFSIIFGIYSSNFGGVAFFLGGGLHQKSSNDEIQSAKNLQRERERDVQNLSNILARQNSNQRSGSDSGSGSENGSH